MQGESGVTGSIIDELLSSDIQGVERKGESGVTRSIFHELHSSDIQGDQTEGESGIIPNVTDELHSSDILEINWKLKVLLLEVSLMNFILRISKEMKRKGKVV